MADDILKNIPLPADLPENWTSGQIIAPTGAEAGLDEQHGYNYLMKQVNNAQKAAKALNEGKLGLHDTADNGVVASGSNYVRFGDGTQICWGQATPAPNITSTEKYISFPLPFAEAAKVLTCPNANMGGVPVQVGWETSTGFTIGCGWNNFTADFGNTSWIAIGRWK